MTPEEQELAIADIEKTLDRLHALYNQYFMGIEKLEPTVVRKTLDRKIDILRRQKIHKSGLRFRLQTQIQKYNTHATYWRRVCRQIEEGTYKPHVMRAQKRQEPFAEHEKVEPAAIRQVDPSSAMTRVFGEEKNLPEQEFEDLSDFSLDDPFAERSRIASHPLDAISSLDDPFGAQETALGPAPQPQQDRRPPQPPGTAKAQDRSATHKKKPLPGRAQEKTQADHIAELDDERLKKLYRTYLAAKKKCDEPTSKISFEEVKKVLRKQYEAKGGGVDFKVVIRNGKAAFKAVKVKNP